MHSEKVKPSAFIVQFLSASIIGYLTTLTGFVYAWPSYNVEVFRSNVTELSAPMTVMEASLLGSVSNLGALLTTPLCGDILNSIGRKKAAILFGVPNVIAWLMIILSNKVYVVLSGMCLAGVSAAGQAVSSVYISEICQDSIRGALSSMVVSGYFAGLLLSYILGGYFTFMQILYVHLGLSVLYIVMLLFLAESPVYLVQIGKDDEAAAAIAFYRRVSVTSKEVDMEIAKIKFQLDPNIDQILQQETDLELEAATNLMEKTKESKVVHQLSPWKFLKNSPSSRRAAIVVFSLMTLSMLMGSSVMQTYAEPILKEAAPSIPANTAAILLAVDFLVAAIICGAVVDRCGRKMLTTYSSAISGTLTFLLGIQLMTGWFAQWVTVVIIYVFCFTYTVGSGIVPFLLTAEVFLPEVRGLCNSLSTGCMWIVNFVTLLVFIPLVDLVGLGPIFIVFSLISFFSSWFSYVYLPETKGMSADAIQVLFLKKKKTEKA